MKTNTKYTVDQDRTLTIDFSGTLYIDAIDCRFVKIEEDGEVNISGDEWLKLPENERSEYVLVSLADTLTNSHDISELEIDIEEDTEE